jgi:F-type H+-transporting ATPase subunit gamma
MSRLRNVERHARSLADIRGIMNSMKSLAYMEVRKLSRIADAQHAVTTQIEKVAEDFLSFHPALLPKGRPTQTACIVVGTERGFCGNFNQRLLAHLKSDREARGQDSMILAVGRKLHTIVAHEMPGDGRIQFIDGAGVAEEVPPVLELLVDALSSLQGESGPLSVWCLHHGSEGEILARDLLPPFRLTGDRADPIGQPPIVNLPPTELLVDLSDQYLLSALYEILYNSLMQENVKRVAHLGDAVKHLDEQTTVLGHQANALRQEEITEEIEVMLLSSSSSNPDDRRN